MPTPPNNFSFCHDATGPTSADGSIVLNLISGQPPFTFAWSNGDSTGNPLHLVPGPYSITITNATGCSVMYDFVVGFTIKTGEPGAFSSGFYPNPASSRLLVKWGNADELRLFDPGGRLVFSQKKSVATEKISLGSLPGGGYRAIFFEKGGQIGSAQLMVFHH